MARSILDLIDYQTKQFEAGRAEGKARRLSDLASKAYSAPQGERRQLFSEMAGVSPEAAYTAQKNMGEMDDNDMSRLARQASYFVGMADGGNEQVVASMYPQLAQEARRLGLGDVPMSYDKAFLPGIRQLAQHAAGQSGRVQSTYVDAMGNRIAIMADGSTQVLGQNAPNNQIIDTGNGFYGVNKGNLNAAPVMVGGQPQPAMAPGSRQISNFQATAHNDATGESIDFASLPPEEQQAAMQAMLTGQSVTLPPARGQQLRSAPKPQGAPSGYSYQADGSLAPIPGGPAQVAIDARAEAAAARKAAEELKAQQKRDSTAQRQAEASTAANQLVSAIDTLTKSEGFSGLGTAWGDVQLNTPLIRNSVKDSQAQLKNIAGQVALTTMARLKALSSQGATGFGALSAPELKLLENSIATLQSDEISNAELKRSLKTIRDSMDKITNWREGQAAPAQQPGGWSIRAID
jgi:hypothetical protein